MNIFVSPVRQERLLLSAFLVILSIGLIGVYEFFLQETNEYIGYMPLSFSLEYLIGLIVSILFSASLIAVKLEKPSDFFQFFYCVLIIIPYGALHEIMGPIGIAKFFLNMATLLIPAILIKLATRNVIYFKFPVAISSRQLIALITVCAILGTIYVAINAPISSGFDILSSNLRRLEAREIFVGSSLGAYVSSITLNGLLPIIAYHSGSGGRSLLLMIAVLCGAVFFYTLGVKAHFLMIGVGYLLGRNVRLNRLGRIWLQMRWLILFVLLAFAIEFVWFGYSYVADYLIRRLFSIPAFILSGYFDLIADSTNKWGLWSGVDSSRGVTYLVGELYFKDPDANANTNAFIYQLAANGVPAFLASILLVIIVLLFIDLNYAAKNNRVFMYLGFIFSVLLVEQNATTVLMSSGVGLLLMAFSVSSAGRETIAPKKKSFPIIVKCTHEVEMNMMQKKYQMCSRCVMDTTDPQILFDESGVCNHCIEFERITRLNWFPNEEGAARLSKILNGIKDDNRDKEYDCILGLSGGVDSSYLALKVKEWGLRPLVVHVDAGWNSELAVANIERIVNHCKYDLHTHVVDWEEMRDLHLAYLRSGISNQDAPQDHVFFASLYHFAVKNKINYILSGGNIATEGIMAASWHEGSAMDSINLKAIHAKYGQHPLRTYKTVNFWQYYLYFPFIKKMRTLRPLNFIPYNKQAAIRELEETIGWKNYGRKHGESLFTKVFQNDYLVRKYGYDKRKPHLSSLIASGQLSREKAVDELHQPLYDESEREVDLNYFCKKLRITREQYEGFVSGPTSSYYDYANWEYKYKILKKLQSIIEKLMNRRVNVYS